MNIKEINWSEVFSRDFWFGIDRLTIHLSDKLFLWTGVGLVALSIVLLLYARFVHNHFLAKVALRISKIFLIIGIIEGLWYLLRIQYIQALGTRFTGMLILLCGLVWLYWPVKYLVVHYKTDMEKAQRDASREKYLQK